MNDAELEMNGGARAGTNQAEADPIRGPSAFSTVGQRFRNAIIADPRAPVREGGIAWPQTALHGVIGRDSGGNVVREMLPLVRLPYGQHNGYQDLVGAFGARAAYIKPVIKALRYQGQIPMDQQPRLMKVKPWMDPYRGSP